MHPRLRDFFNGAFDQINAAFAASPHLSNATKGSMRESAVRRVIDRCLPAITRLHSGDVIDASGRHTGQLDGVVIHANSPALGLEPKGDSIILAEGVVGVIEVKSNLSKQWKQVEKTWKALRPIRRATPTAGFQQGAFYFGSMSHPSDYAVPFYVIGQKAWAEPKELEARARALHDAFGTGYVPPIFILAMNPPSLGAAVPLNGKQYHGTHVSWSHDDRGQVIAQLWAQLSDRARSSIFTPIDWNRYFTPPPAGEVQ